MNTPSLFSCRILSFLGGFTTNFVSRKHAIMKAYYIIDQWKKDTTNLQCFKKRKLDTMPNVYLNQLLYPTELISWHQHRMEIY